MKISEKGLSLIKEFEGCQLNAYRCPSNVWTIGWGHTENVTPNQSITQEEADNLLINDMVKYENYVNTCSNLTFVTNQNQFDALVSFTYNCGQGSLATLVQNRDASTAADKLLLYINGSNGVLQGLVRRRESERQLFLNGEFTSSPVIQEVSQVEKSPIQKAKEFVGSRCLELQQKLNRAFGYNLSEDGDIGQNSYNAILDAQGRLGVSQDGLFGTQSFGSLDNYITSKKIKVVTTTPQSNNVLLIQQLCNFYGARIEEDGRYGVQTEGAIKQYLPICGIQYTTPRATLIAQKILGIRADGIFLYGTKSAVENFQSSQGNLAIDGIIGFSTYCALAKSC